MKIIVISDTHMPKKKKGLPAHLREELQKADHIIHAGDVTDINVLNELISYAPVSAVYGNVDSEEVKKRLPHSAMILLDGISIGIVHGHEGKGRTTKERALRTFMPHLPDIVIFGHSHIPIIEKQEETILFNPGSPTDKRKETYFSYGIIIIQHQKAQCELVMVDGNGNKVESI